MYLHRRIILNLNLKADFYFLSLLYNYYLSFDGFINYFIKNINNAM